MHSPSLLPGWLEYESIVYDDEKAKYSGFKETEGNRKEMKQRREE
jgi:hypothetical protein